MNIPPMTTPILSNAIERTNTTKDRPNARLIKRTDNPVGPKTSAMSGTQIALRPNVEERHMASDNDAVASAAKSDELGPDVDTRTEAPKDEVATVTPAVMTDEPPTTVTAVSYKPGGVSDLTRNAAPAVQSLYMRTQEAIKRQRDLQKYGGYGKEAFNNIQRGEVGLSLVGGRF